MPSPDAPRYALHTSLSPSLRHTPKARALRGPLFGVQGDAIPLPGAWGQRPQGAPAGGLGQRPQESRVKAPTS